MSCRSTPKYDSPVQSKWFTPDSDLDNGADYKDISWLLTVGTLHHAQKSALGHIKGEGISVETLPASDIKTCTILAGQALVQVIGKPKTATTFGDLVRDVRSACLSYLRPCTLLYVRTK